MCATCRWCRRVFVSCVLGSVACFRRQSDPVPGSFKLYLDTMEFFDTWCLLDHKGWVGDSFDEEVKVQRFPEAMLDAMSASELIDTIKSFDEAYFLRNFYGLELTNMSLRYFYGNRLSEVFMDTLVAPGAEILMRVGYKHRMAAFRDIYFGILLRELPQMARVSPEFLGFACLKHLDSSAGKKLICGEGKGVTTFRRFDALSVNGKVESTIATHLLGLSERAEGRALMREAFGVASNYDLWERINQQAKRVMRKFHDVGIALGRDINLVNLMSTTRGRIQIIDFRDAMQTVSSNNYEVFGLYDFIELLDEASSGRRSYSDFRQRLLIVPSEFEKQKEEDVKAMAQAMRVLKTKLRNEHVGTTH